MSSRTRSPRTRTRTARAGLRLDVARRRLEEAAAGGDGPSRDDVLLGLIGDQAAELAEVRSALGALGTFVKALVGEDSTVDGELEDDGLSRSERDHRLFVARIRAGRSH